MSVHLEGIDRVLGTLDRPNALRAISESRHLEVGDVIPVAFEPRWRVKAIEPYRSPVVAITEPGMRYTRSWGLHELDERHTHPVLLVGARISEAATRA